MDFFVAPFAGFAAATVVWLVTRKDGSPSNTVAFCESRDDALRRAREMAQYQHSIGRESRVFVRAEASTAWALAWPEG